MRGVLEICTGKKKKTFRGSPGSERYEKKKSITSRRRNAARRAEACVDVYEYITTYRVFLKWTRKLYGKTTYIIVIHIVFLDYHRYTQQSFVKTSMILALFPHLRPNWNFKIFERFFSQSLRTYYAGFFFHFFIRAIRRLKRKRKLRYLTEQHASIAFVRAVSLEQWWREVFFFL